MAEADDLTPEQTEKLLQFQVSPDIVGKIARRCELNELLFQTKNASLIVAY